jgi:hypothetical protein
MEVDLGFPLPALPVTSPSSVSSTSLASDGVANGPIEKSLTDQQFFFNSPTS